MSEKYSQLYEQVNKICKDDFIVKKDSNLLFILGQSGSGKTTTLEKFKDVPNVVLTELDYFRENRDFKKEDLKDENELLYNFLNFFPKYNLNYKYILQMYTEFLYDFVLFCTIYADMNKDKIFIVSGRNLIYAFVDNEAYGFSLVIEDKYLKNCSIVIKNTSKLKSLFRASVRELNRSEGLSNKLNTLKHYYLNQNTKSDYEEYQQIIDSLKEKLKHL